MSRFNRIYNLIVGVKGSPQAVSITDLRIEFDIDKTITPWPNRSRIKVYNLKEEHREEFEKPDTYIALYAGYVEEGGPTLVCTGNVNYAFSEIASQSGDVITTMELGDGHVALRDGMVSLSYPAGASARKIVNAIAVQMGLALYMDSSLTDKIWSNGFSIHGSGRTALDRVTAAASWQWSVQNNVLQVLTRGTTTKRQIVVLESDSGLIGYPHRERKLPPHAHQVSANAKPHKTRILSPYRRIDGWRVNSLLLPGLNPGDPVQMNSRTIKGLFRVERLLHRGDTNGYSWETEIFIGKTGQQNE